TDPRFKWTSYPLCEDGSGFIVISGIATGITCTPRDGQFVVCIPYSEGTRHRHPPLPCSSPITPDFGKKGKCGFRKIKPNIARQCLGVWAAARKTRRGPVPLYSLTNAEPSTRSFPERSCPSWWCRQPSRSRLYPGPCNPKETCQRERKSIHARYRHPPNRRA